MGKQIEPQAKQIILKVIQFCEEEKKNGLLAPRHLAIKRACLATGLSKYTILKIRNEGQNAAAGGNIGGYTPYGGGEMFHEEEEILGSINEELAPSNTNVHGLVPATSTMEKVQIKIELEEAKEDSAQPAYTDNPSYYVSIKSEPVDAYDEDGVLTTTVVKCEFESTDDPLLPNRSVEEHGLAEGGFGETTKSNNQSRDKENSSEKRTPGSKPAPGTPGGRRHECHICHKTLSTKSKLKTHITLHSTEKPFPCTICPCRYAHKKGLQRHMKTHTDKRFQCSICQKSFMENSKLNRHIKSHTGEKPFGCHLCERRFIRNEELQIHLRIHTGEKPYECNICHTYFTQKVTLQKHLRTHSGTKTHECTICHSWFSCSSSLQVHARTHTGEKPYECSICPSRFAQSIHLHRHLRRHGVSEKSYECDICHNRYPEKHQVRTHLKTHS